MIKINYTTRFLEENSEEVLLFFLVYYTVKFMFGFEVDKLS